MNHRFDSCVGLPRDTDEMSVDQKWIRKRKHRRVETYLVKGTNGSNKNDCIGIIEIWYPGMPLPTSAPNIVEMPGDHLSVDIYVENVLRDTHGLDSGM